MEPTKREFRQLKREIKRAGSQHRRRQWKRDLRDNPEEAPYSQERFGRFSTAAMNGNDSPRGRIEPAVEPPVETNSGERMRPEVDPQDLL